MAKKHRAHVVHAPKGEKALVITKEQLLKMDRAARREAQIESGVNLASGCGVHGGGKKERNRKERREGRRETRDWRNADW